MPIFSSYRVSVESFKLGDRVLSEEYEHGECHHDLKHKGALILMTESEDEPIVEETLVESVLETARKPDLSSKYLESFT